MARRSEIGIDDVIDKKLDVVLALESQTLEGGCHGIERLYPKDDLARRAARERQVRSNFERYFASTAKQYRKQLAKWYGLDLAEKIGYAEAFEIYEYGRRRMRLGPSCVKINKKLSILPNEGARE